MASRDTTGAGRCPEGRRLDVHPAVAVTSRSWGERHPRGQKRELLSFLAGPMPSNRPPCIASAVVVQPDVILMDEPCSALDPVATLKIEELMIELREEYTVVVVTHNMQQAARASDKTIFLTMGEDRAGYFVQQGPTAEILTNPRDQLTGDHSPGRSG